jgi:hypothetical protein
MKSSYDDIANNCFVTTIATIQGTKLRRFHCQSGQGEAVNDE